MCYHQVVYTCNSTHLFAIFYISLSLEEESIRSSYATNCSSSTTYSPPHPLHTSQLQLVRLRKGGRTDLGEEKVFRLQWDRYNASRAQWIQRPLWIWYARGETTFAFFTAYPKLYTIIVNAWLCPFSFTSNVSFTHTLSPTLLQRLESWCTDSRKTKLSSWSMKPRGTHR